MTVYFETDSAKQLIGEFESIESVNRAIYEYCEQQGIKIDYIRSWTEEDNTIVYDIGSHFNFFLIKP